jgi:hypothetical protein
MPRRDEGGSDTNTEHGLGEELLETENELQGLDRAVALEVDVRMKLPYPLLLGPAC